MLDVHCWGAKYGAYTIGKNDLKRWIVIVRNLIRLKWAKSNELSVPHHLVGYDNNSGGFSDLLVMRFCNIYSPLWCLTTMLASSLFVNCSKKWISWWTTQKNEFNNKLSACSVLISTTARISRHWDTTWSYNAELLVGLVVVMLIC